MNEMSFVADYYYFTATELTGDYSGSNFKMNYHTKPLNKGADFAGVFSFKSGTLYNFDQK